MSNEMDPHSFTLLYVATWLMFDVR